MSLSSGAASWAQKAAFNSGRAKSFIRKVEHKVENAIRYVAESGETERPFLRGKSILDILMTTPGFNQLSDNITTLQSSATDSFLIVTRTPATMEHLLKIVPSIVVNNIKFTAEIGASDIFEFKPRNLKVMIYDAPLSTKDEILVNRLKSYGDVIDDKIYWEMYAPPFAHIQTGNRFVFMKNVGPREGLPLSLNISSNKIKLRHPGQIRDPEARAKLRSQYENDPRNNQQTRPGEQNQRTENITLGVEPPDQPMNRTSAESNDDYLLEMEKFLSPYETELDMNEQVAGDVRCNKTTGTRKGKRTLPNSEWDRLEAIQAEVEKMEAEKIKKDNEEKEKRERLRVEEQKKKLLEEKENEEEYRRMIEEQDRRDIQSRKDKERNNRAKKQTEMREQSETIMTDGCDQSTHDQTEEDDTRYGTEGEGDTTFEEDSETSEDEGLEKENLEVTIVDEIKTIEDEIEETKEVIKGEENEHRKREKEKRIIEEEDSMTKEQCRRKKQSKKDRAKNKKKKSIPEQQKTLNDFFMKDKQDGDKEVETKPDNKGRNERTTNTGEEETDSSDDENNKLWEKGGSPDRQKRQRKRNREALSPPTPTQIQDNKKTNLTQVPYNKPSVEKNKGEPENSDGEECKSSEERNENIGKNPCESRRLENVEEESENEQ